MRSRKSLVDEAAQRHAEIHSAENRAAKAKKEADSAKAGRKLAELVIDSLKEQIETEREKYRIPVAKSRVTKGSFIRVLVPDSHGAHIDKQAAAALLGDLEHLKPKEVILMGDHLDCGGFLAQHHTMGYVAETFIGFADDVASANEFLDGIQKQVGSQRIDYIEGNHEQRIERWCVTEALRRTGDAQFLLDRLGPEAVLHLKRRGIKYHRMAEFHDGLNIRGTLKRGDCYYTHGLFHGKDAARKHLGIIGGNIVFVHTHRESSASGEQVARGQIRAWGIGCICQRRPYWHHTRPSEWTTDYAIQIVRDDGFLHISVPIIDGKSYLMDLTSRLN